MNKLTIFTPTYNRANLLPNLYKSLVKQSNKNFIWLLIDDGSTDETEQLASEWQKLKNSFKIEYVKKENGGKNTAIDLSNQLCQTEYIMCVDSDDYLTSDAVDKIYKEIDKICKKTDVCGIVTRRSHSNGAPFQTNWPNEDFKELYFYELSRKYGYSADTCLIFKTDIISRYHFPKIDGENFITESVFYNQFIHDYRILASRNLYYVAEYMPDGYTNQGMSLFFRNPQGYLYSIKQNLHVAIKNGYSFRTKCALSANYYAWKRINKIKDKFKTEYKIPFIYKVFGTLFSSKFYHNYKKEVKNRQLK